MDRCTKIISNNIHKDLNSKLISTKTSPKAKSIKMLKIKFIARMTSQWIIMLKIAWNTNSNHIKFKRNMIFTIRYKMFKIKKIRAISFLSKSLMPKINLKILTMFRQERIIMSKKIKENMIIVLTKIALIWVMIKLDFLTMIMKIFKVCLLSNLVMSQLWKIFQGVKLELSLFIIIVTIKKATKFQKKDNHP